MQIRSVMGGRVLVTPSKLKDSRRDLIVDVREEVVLFARVNFRGPRVPLDEGMRVMRSLLWCAFRASWFLPLRDQQAWMEAFITSAIPACGFMPPSGPWAMGEAKLNTFDANFRGAVNLAVRRGLLSILEKHHENQDHRRPSS